MEKYKSLNKSRLRNILNEAYDKEKHPGWERSPENREALSMLKTRKPGAETQLVDAFKEKGINAEIDFDNYYFWEQFHRFWDTLYSIYDDVDIGESGKELGISGIGDPYTYQKIGDNKYRVLAGPVAKAIGTEFTPKKEEPEDKFKAGRKKATGVNRLWNDNTEEDPVILYDAGAAGYQEYQIGNTGTYKGIRGTKLLVRDYDDRNVEFTFLIPNSLKSSEILGRIPGEEFVSITWEMFAADLQIAIDAFEMLTGKKIKLDNKPKPVKLNVAGNKKLFIEKAAAEGITQDENPLLLAAMLAVVQKETGFKMKDEIPYNNTSNERIRKIFKARVKNLTDTELNALKSDEEAFFNYVYGDGQPVVVSGVQVPLSYYNQLYGKSFGEMQLGNKQPGDGFRFVGRGLNQLTGRGSYKKYSKISGVDILNNPDALNQSEVAVEVAVKFIANGIRSLLKLSSKSGFPTITDKEEAIVLAARANAGTGYSLSSDKVKMALDNTRREIDQFLSEKRKIKNNKKENEMILNELTIRRIVRNAILKENTEAIKNIQDVIGDTADGDWRMSGENSTNDLWLQWVENHADNIAKLAVDNSISKSNVLSHKDNAGNLAAIILNDPKKENIEGVSEFIDLYRKKYKSEIEKEKAQREKRKEEEAKFDTGGKYVFMSSGPTSRGIYPPDKKVGMKNSFYKIFKDKDTYALDAKTGDLYARKRGSADPFKLLTQKEKIKKDIQASKEAFQDKTGIYVTGPVRESLENKLILENFMNPAKFYLDLKRGENISDPTNTFKNNKKRITGLARTKSKEYPYEHPMIKNLDMNDHDFADEYTLPIKFEQQDMSKHANVALELMEAWGKRHESTDEGIEFIRDEIMKVNVKNFGGTASDAYIARLAPTVKTHGYPWSGWFLNRCIVPGSPLFNVLSKDILSLNSKAAGCCYPWSFGNQARKQIVDNMEESIGQTKLVLFSKEEIDIRSDLKITDGVLTVKAYGSGKSNDMKSLKGYLKHGSGLHMNVVTSKGAIGGNLGGKIKSDGSNDKYTAYYILVKVVKNQPELG